LKKGYIYFCLDKFLRYILGSLRVFPSRTLTGLRGADYIFVPEGYMHSYWTYVLKLEFGKVDFTWYDFRNKYMELGGDGIYAAWKLNYLEPVFREHIINQRECTTQFPHYKGSFRIME